jgi:hypothetical protein
MIWSTASSTDVEPACTWISGDAGASYGAEMPVNSAARASAQSLREMSLCRLAVCYAGSPAIAVDRRTPGTPRTLDLAGARLLVQALGVALLALLDAGVDEDLDEGQRRVVLGVQRARQVAVRGVGRDERRDRQRRRRGEEQRDLRGVSAGCHACGTDAVPVQRRARAALLHILSGQRMHRAHPPPLHSRDAPRRCGGCSPRGPWG